MPANWQDTKGLWLIYYYTLIAECGLNRNDLKIDVNKINFNLQAFGYGCADYLLLRALVMLGYFNEMEDILMNLNKEQLPDGGFLCLDRMKKIKHTPKSCVKNNNLALMFCAECKKRGIELNIEKSLLSYYWKHNLFYQSADLAKLILDAKIGWRTVDTFFPNEVMRIGIQNIVEAFCALGYGSDKRLDEAWDILYSNRDDEGKYTLRGTLTKSYLPKETVGKPSKWITFYALLAEKEKTVHGLF